MELKNNRDLLYDLYVNKEFSLSKIASMYSVSSMTVRAWLHKNKINTRTSTQTIYKELKQTSFSESQKSLIIGSLLGDGSIILGKDCVNARFIERHGEQQREYLLWKRNSLKPFTMSKITETDSGTHEISGNKCKVSKSYMFSTISHPYLTELHKLFYMNNKKIVPLNLYNMLNGLALAVWLCDDGSLTYNEKHGIYRLDLHTESFTYKETVFLCREVLSKYFNVSFRINSRVYKSGKAFYICLSNKHKVKNVVNAIKEFIPECMLYKFKDYIT
jgi:hypothetical protein